MNKNYILNTLLLFFTIIILLTLKTNIFYYSLAFCSEFGFIEHGQKLASFYTNSIFTPILITNDCTTEGCSPVESNVLFDIHYKFSFENIVFKFSLLSILLLSLLKYRKREWKVDFDRDGLLITILLIIAIFLYIKKFVVLEAMVSLYQKDWQHILQSFVFVLLNIELFILFPLIALFIWKDQILNLFLKIVGILLLSSFVYLATTGIGGFLTMTIEYYTLFNVDYGLIYLLKTYGLSAAECSPDPAFIAQPKPSTSSNCSLLKYMSEKSCYETNALQNPPSKLQCDLFTDQFQRYCKTFYSADSKK